MRTAFQPGEQYILTPSEIYNYVGTKLPGRSFLSVAAQNNVSVFCGAISDSEFAMDLMRYRKYKDIKIILDEMGDIETFASLIRRSDTWGTIILGGGDTSELVTTNFPIFGSNKGTR